MLTTSLASADDSQIGAATVKALLNEGVRKILIADVNQAGLEKFRSELLQTYPDAQIEVCAVDLSDVKQADAMVARAVEKFGRIDYCLNSAGVAGGGKKLGDTDPEEVSGAWVLEGTRRGSCRLA